MKTAHIKPICIWLTGLSGSGKTSIAKALQSKLKELNTVSVHIDGDDVRKSISSDLKFSRDDRIENARRIAHIGQLIYQNNMISIISTISPYKASRIYARSLFPKDSFIEVYINTPMEVCRQRDPKHLYTAFDAGQLQNMTGVDMPYEISNHVDIEIDTKISDINDSVEKIIARIDTCRI